MIRLKDTVLTGSAEMTAGLQTSLNMVMPNYQTGLLEDMLSTGKNNDSSTIDLNNLYREIYLYDTVSGPTVDLMCNLPWSDFTLSGVDDPVVRQTYEDSLYELNVEDLMPKLSVSYLVLGTVIGSLIFNESKGIFTDLIVQDPDFCEVTEIPLSGYDPKIDLKVNPEFKKFLRSKDPRDVAARKEIPSTLLNKLLKGNKIELEPLSTIYINRNYVPGLNTVSYYNRIVPIWLIEKALMRGTIIGSWRRQRSILHIQAGNEDWTPTSGQLASIAQMFTNADQDPQGAVVVTRQGIDTNEVRCITGDTLISGENGLERIDSLVEHTPDKNNTPVSFEFSYPIKGIDGKLHNTTHWHYRGYTDTVKVTSDSGYIFKGTKDHKILALNDKGDLKLTKAEKTLNKYICLEVNGEEVSSKLPLNLTRPDVMYRKTNKDITIPKYMTTHLAYILGFICSDGQLYEHGIQVSSTDYQQLLKFKHCIKKVFNINCDIVSEKCWVGPYKTEINGDICTRNKQLHWIIISTKVLSSYFVQLGVIGGFNKEGEGHTSWYKQIPWSIMQADANSKYAFIAAFVDGDGRISTKDTKGNSVEITIFSSSESILNGFKILLSDLGYISRLADRALNLSSGSGSKLYNHIKKYLQCERKKHYNYCDDTVNRQYGIPPEAFIPILEERFVRRNNPQVGGSWFTDDEGDPVLVKIRYGEVFRHYKHEKSKSYMLYRVFDNGGYKQELELIKQVSKSLYKKLMYLFTIRPKFEKVVNIEDNGKQHVYDLTMAEKPVFVANGIIIKNSGSDFWKVSDEWDVFANAKMRALGVSEAFLTGDSNFNTQEIALSVFMDNLRAFRVMLTNKVIYDKIFIMLAKFHGFKRRTQAELNHRLRLTSAKTVSNYNDYNIPTINWHKDLKSKYDMSYSDALDKAKEQGIPIPLTLYASVAGLNSRELMEALDDDIKFRKDIKTYNDKLAALGASPTTGSDEDEDAVFSSVAESAESERFKRSDPKVLMREQVLSEDTANAILAKQTR